MLRRSSCFARFRAPVRPTAPQHTGSPLQVGEQCLLRRPDAWVDCKVQLRGLDRDLALVLIADQLERVPLANLRRP